LDTAKTISAGGRPLKGVQEFLCLAAGRAARARGHARNTRLGCRKRRKV